MSQNIASDHVFEQLLLTAQLKNNCQGFSTKVSWSHLQTPHTSKYKHLQWKLTVSELEIQNILLSYSITGHMQGKHIKLIKNNASAD